MTRAGLRGVAAGALLAAVCVAGEREVDILHYDLEVTVQERSLEVEVDLEARADRLPKRWELSLARTMKVESVDPVPFARQDDSVVLDLSGVAPGTFRVAFRLSGAPYVKFSARRGGFVRTAITPEIAYVRGQYPWYPRNGDDAATFSVRVRAPEGWLVRTAGEETAPGEFEQSRPCRRVGLVAAPYERVELGPDLDALVPRGGETDLTPLLEGARKAMAHYRARLGPIDLGRFTLVSMPDAFGPDSGYGEEGYILVGRRAGLPLVAHEVAHSWWGSEVAFTDFAGEMLASYSALRFLEAEQGPDAARGVRSRAVRSVLRCAEAGKEISLLDLEGFGAGVDPQSYRAHAYDKAMMLLVMLEDALGRKKLDGILAGIVEANRGEVYRYRRLREDLFRRGGAATRRLLALWEAPGIPTLEVECKPRKGGKVKGTLSQRGTPRPFPLDVTVRAICGETQVDTKVKLRGKRASFSLRVPSAPDAVVIDPEYRLVVGRVDYGSTDPAAALDAALKVVSNPKESDAALLEKTVASLRRALAAGADEGLSRMAMGRCLFRLGRNDEAKKEFRAALKVGVSPFHRAWTYLRLGCLADLDGRREKAEKHYRQAAATRPGSYQAKLAQRFLKRPYRGYGKDG